MNEHQIEHLNGLLDWAVKEIDKKYRKGAREHQSTLSKDYNSVELINMIIEEAIDQLVYAYTLKEKLNEEL